MRVNTPWLVSNFVINENGCVWHKFKLRHRLPAIVLDISAAVGKCAAWWPVENFRHIASDGLQPSASLQTQLGARSK
jgi:hypothetical protein